MADHLATTTWRYREGLGLRLGEVTRKFDTKSDAASAGGVSVEQFNKWLKGTVKVPADALYSIAEEAGVDFSWLVTGKGDMDAHPETGKLRQLLKDVSDAPKMIDRGPAVLDQPGMVSIPRYDEVRPSAGPGSVATSETPTTRVAFERHWLAEIGVQTDSAVILPAQGDSMEPTIMNGSPMLVDTSKTEVQNGYIYVIAVENDLLVKRIRRRLDGRIDLISDNRAYDPETLDAVSLQHLRVIGRVYAAVSKF